MKKDTRFFPVGSRVRVKTHNGCCETNIFCVPPYPIGYEFVVENIMDSWDRECCHYPQTGTGVYYHYLELAEEAELIPLIFN